MITAGQVGFFEWVLIVIGLLWVAGFLRTTIYVPVVIKETKNDQDKKQDETKIAENVTITKNKNNSSDQQYTPFEEIKD